LLIVVTPASARSTVVAQKASKKSGTVYIAHRLVSGHRYRIDVVSKHHRTFAGNAIENYISVKSGRLVQGVHPMKLSGTTPKSFSLTQPVSGHLGSWIVALTVDSARARRLIVRIVDTTS
jgi:hypothetical protein